MLAFVGCRSGPRNGARATQFVEESSPRPYIQPFLLLARSPDDVGPLGGDGTPGLSDVLPSGCLSWRAWTSTFLSLLMQGLQGALPSVREGRVATGA